MTKNQITQSVTNFADLSQGFSEADLAGDWAWGDYDEGIRYAFFRVYEELRQLASNLATERAAAQPEVTTAQRALAQYHAAYRDLQAVLVGVSAAEYDKPPAKDEWPLRKVLEHIIRAEMRFFAILYYNLDRQRSGDANPGKVPDDDWDAINGPYENHTQVLEEKPLSAVLAHYEIHHQRVLKDLAVISQEELQLPTAFWESTPMPIQFRLHRFDAHLRQHTIQTEKTLAAISGPPSEAKRLLRLIYAALAEVEGLTIGAPQLGSTERRALAEKIAQWTDEIAAAIAG